MSDAQLAASVLALLDGTADTFLVCAGAGAVVSQKTAAQAKTLLALVKADVGLGSVDNTADTAKPVSTAQQTALDAKLNLSGGTLTGNVSTNADITLTGVNKGIYINSGGTSRGLIYYSASQNRLNSTGSIPWVVESNSGFAVRNAANTAGAALTASEITASALMCAGTYTVATLPSASANSYKFATVSDSSVTTFGSTVAAGGSSKVMVFSNGTNWTVCAS